MTDLAERLTRDLREIADIAGIPAATVRSHLRRGLAALKKELV